ncbi:MAG TPA: hypothetical protein VMZ53_25540 [Kofleriaceae bacterium]|nr:hypothetical protein [Kofleriaceae bacterium]
MRITPAAAIVLLAACADSAPEAQKDVPGTVNVDEDTESRIAGSYVAGDDTLLFDASEIDTNLISVTVKLHGLTIDATLDTRDGNRMWSQDAFATDTGADSVITEDDQEMMARFVKALEAENIGISEGNGLAFHFGTVINLWAEWTPAMDPVRIKFEDRDRAVDMCWFASAPDRYHDYDGHDCSSCSGDPGQGQGRTNCSSYVAYGPYYAGTTYYYKGGTWVSGDDMDGHGNYDYQTGNCYGRYGGGCGSGSAYFRENASHDHCVRNGHVIGSSWCSDELWNTTQPYNCF